MKKLIICIVTLLCVIASANNYKLSKKVTDNQSLPFISHAGTGAFDSYLTMEVQYSPVESLFQQVQQQEKVKLKNRGEAHITVITPVEYFQVLKDKIQIKEINAIALKHDIQASQFKIECLGRGTARINQRTESTYYLVVSSDKLLNIRKKIQDVFVARGGDAKKFEPQHYFPHITLGFTDRDLHESDGVIKNKKSCVAAVVTE